MLTDYLDFKGIDHKIGPAKNVSSGWVGIQCPLPGCSDSSNHCGISLGSYRFHCLVCGRSGHLIDLIKEIEGCSYSNAKRIFEGIRRDAGSDATPGVAPPYRKPTCVSPNDFEYPPWGTLPEVPPMHKEYLRSRGYSPNDLIKKYGLRATMHLGDYPYRIIIPIILDNRVVSFTSRDITGKQERKALHMSIEKSILSPKDMLYGIDMAYSRAVVLVEGPFDAWRIGDGACAIFGTGLSMAQIDLLLRKRIKKIYLMLDADTPGRDASKKLKCELSNLFQVEALKLKGKGDPDSLLTPEDVSRLQDMLKRGR